MAWGVFLPFSKSGVRRLAVGLLAQRQLGQIAMMMLFFSLEIMVLGSDKPFWCTNSFLLAQISFAVNVASCSS